jgi:hypothetical protein
MSMSVSIGEKLDKYDRKNCIDECTSKLFRMIFFNFDLSKLAIKIIANILYRVVKASTGRMINETCGVTFEVNQAEERIRFTQHLDLMNSQNYTVL